MRLGEIKNILDKYLTPEHIIALDVENNRAYGNQYVVIKNYNKLVFIENFVAEQGLIVQGREVFLNAIKPNNPNSSEVIMQTGIVNQISQYINALNQFVRIYYLTLNTMVKPQDPQLLNIKLPDRDNFSIKDMEKLMKKLHVILNGISDAIDIAASFDIVGVDSGSKWLEVKIGVGPENTIKLFTVIMGLLGIAILTLELRESYYKSETAKLSYEILEQEYKEKTSFDEHVIRMVDKKRGADIENLLKQTGVDKPDAKNKMDTIVVHIVETLRDGVEFHPSLNPPEYIKEESGEIHIDYDKLHEIEAKAKKPKQITEDKSENTEVGDK